MVDPLTQLTPRTLEGTIEPEITTGRVLPYSTNPREGWKSKLRGGTAAVLVADHCDLRRIDKSAILDYDGFLPSVSMDRLSKRASFDVGALSSISKHSSSLPILQLSAPEVENGDRMFFQNTSFHVEVEEDRLQPSVFSNNHGDGGSKKSLQDAEDADPSWDESPSQSRAPSRGATLHSPEGLLSPDEDMRVDIFRTDSMPLNSPSKGKTGIYKGGSFNKGSGVFPTASLIDRPSFHESFNMEDVIESDRGGDDDSVFSLTNANPGFQSTNKEVIRALQQASMNSITSASVVLDMPSKLEKSQSFVFDNDGVGPEGDFARLIEDDVILDGLAVMKKIGKPNYRNVHTLNLRSAYDGYSSGGEPLYTESMPTATGGNGAVCTDYIFFSASSLVASRVLSLPPLSQLRGDDPRQPVAVLDSNWSTPPPSLNPFYNNHNSLGVDPSILISGRGVAPAVVKQVAAQLKAKLRPIIEASTDTDPIYGGFWSYFSSYNSQRLHSWLPNEQFGSSHIALCAEFFVYDDNVAVEWM